MLGNFRSVLFFPDDLRLVKGEPDERRSFLNVAISQCYPTYLADYKRFKEALESRNSLLKSSQKGQYVDAQRYIDIACSMDPYNREYRAAKEQLHRQANGYGGGYDAPRAVGCSCCDICAGLMCMDCLCSCMGCH